MRKYLYVILMTSLLFACSKENSIENDANSGNNNGTLGSNCKINTIITADSITGKGLYSLFTTFKAGARAERIEAYDSNRFATDATANLTYNGDTIRISATEYFVTDAAKRVSKYYSLVDPSDPASEIFIYSYFYDASGYLKEKSISLPSIPVPVVKFLYTWSGGNLVKIDGSSLLSGSNQKVLNATMTYDASKTAKNFLQILPDNFESFFYTMALDMGKKSTNVVKTISMITYDENGSPADTYNTTLKNLVFSPDGYLTEWYAEGDSFDPLGIFSGRTLFKYSCN